MGCGNSDNSTGDTITQKEIAKNPKNKRIVRVPSKPIIPDNEIEISPKHFIQEKSDNIIKYYDLKEEIGSGSFGKVRKCIYKGNGQVRAVKILKKSYVNEEDRKRFFDEIAILKNIDHPNIMKLYQLFQDSKFYYLITEYIEGGELFDKITQQKYFSEEDSAIVMSQLLSAVSYCHANNIVHRDLKPENLLLESKGENYNIKVIDFGTSQVYMKNIKMKEKYGTSYYIAPEVLGKNYDEKCDIWSCGVIMYIMLCGYPPFNGKDDAEIMNAVRKGTYNFKGPIWKNISNEAKDLIAKLLTYFPKNRISASDALQHRWFQSVKSHIEPSESQNLVRSLKNFRASQKLQHAALIYMASQLLSKEDTKEMQSIFKSFDLNHDGKLSREELIKGFKTFYGMSENVEEEVDQIMENVDVDHSGFIDYTEFVVACINKRKLLSKEKLLATFNMFDVDGSGSISIDEVKSILGVGKNVSDDVWKNLMADIKNNNDQISFKDFEQMMLKIIN